MVTLLRKIEQTNEAKGVNLVTLAVPTRTEDEVVDAIYFQTPCEYQEVLPQDQAIPDIAIPSPEVARPDSQPSIVERFLASIARVFWALNDGLDGPAKSQREREQQKVAEFERWYRHFTP